MGHDHPLWVALDRAQMDLRNANARLTEIRTQVAALDLKATPRPACPNCGLLFQLAWQRDEHVYHSHDGPVPEHYLAAERAAGLEAAPHSDAL